MFKKTCQPGYSGLYRAGLTDQVLEEYLNEDDVTIEANSMKQTIVSGRLIDFQHFPDLRHLCQLGQLG